MVSDVDIVRRLTGVLRDADLSTTTTTAIRKQLEKELKVDLSSKKVFIREQVDLYLKEQADQEAEQNQDNGAGVEEEGVEEEEEEELGVEGEEEEQDEEEQEQEVEQENGGEVEEDEDEEEEDNRPAPRKSMQANQEPDSKRLRAKIDRAKKDSMPKEKKKRAGGGGGLNKACCLSPELQAVIGESELPRTQVVKQLWVYIRQNELQDPDNRRKIVCNDELRGLFGVDSTDIFKMNRLLSKHIWPLEKAADGGEPKAKKAKTAKTFGDKPKTEKKESERSQSETDRPKVDRKDSGRGRSQEAKLLPLSEALVDFLGTDETEMAQHEVAKSLWDYIAENKLQDPNDKKIITCDEKLQDLFGCDTFVGYSLTKLLAPHLKG